MRSSLLFFAAALMLVACSNQSEAQSPKRPEPKASPSPAPNTSVSPVDSPGEAAPVPEQSITYNDRDYELYAPGGVRCINARALLAKARRQGTPTTPGLELDLAKCRFYEQPL
jgi:hypothetical protein